MSRINRGLEALSSPHICNKKVSISDARNSLYQTEKLVTVTVYFRALQADISTSKAARKDCIAAIL
jgi:hypothetical protein